MTDAISTRGLRKAYGDKVVLDGIDLHVAEGTIFALLGPNRESWIVLTASSLAGAASCLVRRYVRDLTRRAAWSAWPRPRWRRRGRFATRFVSVAWIG